MKIFRILMILAFAGMGVMSANGQNILAGTMWRCQGTPFEYETTTKFEFTLHQDDPDDFMMNWGHFINFHDDGTFATSYRAPCGNDCFTSISGTYSFLEDSIVVIYVDTIGRSGFCQKETEYPKKTYGKYKISRSEDTLSFTKLADQ